MSVRTATVAICWLACFTAPVSRAGAQNPSLEVFGLAPGGSLADLQDRLAKVGGKPGCKTSPVDHRVTECTATLARTPDRRNWALTASVVDGTVSMMWLRASTDARGFDGLREEWTARLGRPNLKHVGNFDSYQWIRAGRILKLAGRNERGHYEVTVSLVDGEVLDRLGGN